jgi:hypothetical protein
VAISQKHFPKMNDVVDYMSSLNITDRISENSTDRNQSALVEAIHDVAEAAVATAQLGQRVSAFTNPISDGDVVGIRLLHREAKRLAASANDLINATERAIVDQIRAIARNILDTNDTAACVMWKIAEECYNEANKTAGKIHSDHFFIPLEESYLESPYDPDFESEAYYEHEKSSRN